MDSRNSADSLLHCCGVGLKISAKVGIPRRFSAISAAGSVGYSIICHAVWPTGRANCIDNDCPSWCDLDILYTQPIEKKLVMDQMLQHSGQGTIKAAYRNPLLAPMAEIVQYTKLHGLRALYRYLSISAPVICAILSQSSRIIVCHGHPVHTYVKPLPKLLTSPKFDVRTVL